MKKNIFLGLLFFAIAPFTSFAELSNVGIIQGVWFSEEPFFDGDAIRVYTAVQNNSGGDVDGIIEFFDNGDLIGQKDFSALNHRIIESWIDVVAVSGKHEFSVLIKNVEKDIPGQDPVSIESVSFTSGKDIVVYVDTDGDNISDKDDLDDDNDGYSDIEERRAGTDSLNASDTPEPTTDNQTDTANTAKNFINNTAENLQDVFAIDDAEVKILRENIPEALRSLTNEHSLLEVMALQVSRLQQTATKGIESAEKKISLEKNETKNVEGEDSTLEEQVTGFARSGIVTGVLGILKKIIAIWWVFPILIFVGIWLFLKLIFKIFGRRSRR